MPTPGWLPYPDTWPKNPLQIAVPPEITDSPTSFDLISDVDLAELAFMMRLACGRSNQIFKQPRRYLLCLLAQVMDYELEKRLHPKI